MEKIQLLNTYKKLFIQSLMIASLIIISNISFGQAQDSSSTSSASQSPTRTKPKKKFDPSRIVVSGIFGAQFGNDVTFIEVSPNVGYLFTDNFLAGVGFRYQYFEQKLVGFTYKSNIYGGSVFGQYYFFRNFINNAQLIAHAEYEFLNLDDFNNPEKRTNVNSILVGGGIRAMMGGRSFLSFLILYNLNETINTPYDNPMIRIGFGIGI